MTDATIEELNDQLTAAQTRAEQIGEDIATVAAVRERILARDGEDTAYVPLGDANALLNRLEEFQKGTEQRISYLTDQRDLAIFRSQQAEAISA